jgi:hypothetical protein
MSESFILDFIAIFIQECTIMWTSNTEQLDISFQRRCLAHTLAIRVCHICLVWPVIRNDCVCMLSPNWKPTMLKTLRSDVQASAKPGNIQYAKDSEMG